MSGPCPVSASVVVTVTPNPVAGTITGTDSMCIGTLITLSDPAPGGIWSSVSAVASVSGSGLVTGLLRGTATIKYTVTNLCGTAVATKIIRIDSFPNAGSIVGIDSLCEGATFTFTDSKPGGVWNSINSKATVTSAGEVYGAAPGVDTITYTVGNTCGTASTNTVVAIKPLPHVGPIVCDSVVCQYGYLAFSDSVPGGFWTQSNDHGMFTGPGSYYGLTLGTDTLYYSLNNSCGGTYATKRITIIDCDKSGVTILPAGPQVRIFPNPASSVLNIEWMNMAPGGANIIMTDVMGRIVLNNEITSIGNGITELNISGIKEGIYLVTIHSDSAHFTSKITIGRW